MTAHDREGQGRDPNMFCAQYLTNGLEIQTGAPIRYGAWRVMWSRNRRRHVTQNGQGRERNMLRTQYRENDWTYVLVCSTYGQGWNCRGGWGVELDPPVHVNRRLFLSENRL